MTSAPLRGCRVLLVEDNGAQARQFGRLLQQAGAEVIGPAKTIASAERLIAEHEPAAAWLDVCLDDDVKIWPLARLLERRSIPFIFCTSSPDEIERAHWPGRPIVAKPLSTRQAQADTLALLAGLINSALPTKAAAF